MHKVEIIKDERWPDYGMYERKDGGYRVIEVSDELWDRCKAVDATYDAMQAELEKLYKASL